MKTSTSTRINHRGQVVVPALIRKRHNIKPGDRLVWIDDGLAVKVIPIPDDPIGALRGDARGQHLLETLLEMRKQDELHRA